jgi:DNA mismatch repair protein MutL
MGKIKLLSDEIINQIAAGEIVERPASALKEIVENSIDAGANNIDIFINGGGKEKIVVEDNGIGLSIEDLQMAIKRHATSKLNSDNLFGITSYGFRGEAIPSIASVSNFSMESLGHGITVDFSKESDVYPSTTSTGTKVIIENLFNKIPARLKFLKSCAAELTHCLNVLENIALVKTNINLTVRSDKKNLLLFKESSVEDRISRIVGSDTFQRSIYFSEGGDSISIKGYLFHPADNRHSQGAQKVFINDRIVNDKITSIAIKNAYKDLIPSGRFAVAILFITIDPFLIDVNVSPTKSEARFRDSASIKKFITSAISRNLTKFDRVIIGVDIPTAQWRQTPISMDSAILHETHYNGVKDGTTGAAVCEYVNQPSETITYDQPYISPIINRDSSPSFFGRPIAQLFDSYIVTVIDDGILIIDQHAVHEKITQHELLQNIKAENKRFIVKPEILQLSESQINIATDMINYINACGFAAEINLDSIIISAIPQIINISDALGFIRDILENHDAVENVNVEDNMKRKIADIACHNSIRFGRRLSIDEMTHIVKQMEETPSIHQCNHHRTSFVKITKTQLEKMFDRK